MSIRFEELAWRQTPMGEISLRRRLDPALHQQVYEVKLGDEYLMSSLFTVAEVELARLGLAELTGAETQGGVGEAGGEGEAGEAGEAGAERLDVVVGGLGLGYTARTVLADHRVRSLLVVDALDEVIAWHHRGLLPDAAALTGDARCRLLHGDFFALTADPAGYDPDAPGGRVHAVLADIDHSPRHLLHPRHAEFYTAAGLRRLAGHLHPGGVFGLWSNDPPDDEFTAVLGEVFATARAEVISFDNPLQGRTSTNTIYLARVRR